MGRSFESIRLGVKNTADRWLKARRAMRQDDQIYAERVAGMAKKHSSEGFYAFDDPLEAAVFSVLVEIVKEMDRQGGGGSASAGPAPAESTSPSKPASSAKSSTPPA
ncbi:MAG: hypothetical protein RQ758_01525 [Methanomicrobiaceae archaeon]|nr:hypothetical protein [Methanomicrobiaceae archaeon]